MFDYNQLGNRGGGGADFPPLQKVRPEVPHTHLPFTHTPLVTEQVPRVGRQTASTHRAGGVHQGRRGSECAATPSPPARPPARTHPHTHTARGDQETEQPTHCRSTGRQGRALVFNDSSSQSKQSSDGCLKARRLFDVTGNTTVQCTSIGVSFQSQLRALSTSYQERSQAGP